MKCKYYYDYKFFTDVLGKIRAFTKTFLEDFYCFSYVLNIYHWNCVIK